MSEFLGIDINYLDDGRFQFSQNGLIFKVLGATGMDHCNGYLISTRFEAPIGTYHNVPKANIYLPYSYDTMLYMSSN